MATETKTKKPESIRTEAYKKAHRKMAEMMLNDGTQRMLLEHIEMLETNMLRAKKELHDYILRNVVDGVIEPANAKLDPNMQQTSLALHMPDGMTKFHINQQISRQFDDRAQQATALITDFINDHKMVEVSKEVGFLMQMLEAMLFGASRKKQFRFTPELQKFMSMQDDELPDNRLIKARDILNEAFYTHRSQWYYGIEKYDENQRKYVKLEEYLFGNS
tara:strand:+ start:872 stop:1528 length:657 start_codon:yes stop_codon:yes gene_type:complete